MKFSSSLLSVVLIPLLITGQLPAQSSAVAPAPAQALHVRVIPASAATTPKGFTFEVTDAQGAPVSDAAVSLRLPDSGATGVFSDGTHSAVAYTNQSGQAQISGIQWGEATGTASMRVTATKDTAHAGMLLEQSITPTIAKTASLPSVKLAEPAQTKQLAPVAMPVTTIPLTPKIEVQPKHDPIPPIASGAEPSVSVTNGPNANQPHSSKTKWYVIAAVVVAGGAAGALMMGKSKSSGSSSAAPSLSIGAPSVSIGH